MVGGGGYGGGGRGRGESKYVPLVEFIYLVFTRMPGESYRRQLRSFVRCVCVTSFER